MARIRTIKPDFFRHSGLYDLERDTGLPVRLAFAGLWTVADRAGRFAWRPRELKLDCLPYDDVDFSRVLDALVTRGYLVRYESAGVEYGCIPSWDRHQIINNRESPSRIPPPEEGSVKSTTSTRAPRVEDACATPLKHAQAEGEGEGERNTVPNGTGAKAPSHRDVVFGVGVPMLTAAGTPEKQARSFLALQSRTHGDAVVADALHRCAEAQALEPLSWLTKALGKPGRAPEPPKSFRERDAELAKAEAAKWMPSYARQNVIDLEDITDARTPRLAAS